MISPVFLFKLFHVKIFYLLVFIGKYFICHLKEIMNEECFYFVVK